MKEMERRVMQRLEQPEKRLRGQYWMSIGVLGLGIVLMASGVAMDMWFQAVLGVFNMLFGLLLYMQVEVYVIARRLAGQSTAQA